MYDLQTLKAQHSTFATSENTSIGQRVDSETILALISEIERLKKLKPLNHNPKSFLILREYSIGAPMSNDVSKISITHLSGEAMDTDIEHLLKELDVDEQKIHSYFERFF